MTNPWDRPREVPTHSDASAEQIHTAVGRCLSTWESVENSLAIIFAHTCNIERDLALEIYTSLPSSNAKHNMLAVATDHVYKRCKEKLSICRAAIKIVRDFSPRRNDIAHGTTSRLEESGFVLTGPLHSKKAYNIEANLPNYSFDLDKLEFYYECFRAICLELTNVTFCLFDHEPPAYFQTPLSQYLRPSIDALRKTRNQELPEYPPGSSPA